MARHQAHRSANSTEPGTRTPSAPPNRDLWQSAVDRRSGPGDRWSDDRPPEERHRSVWEEEERRGFYGERAPDRSDRFESEERRRRGAPARESGRGGDHRPSDGNGRYGSGDHGDAYRAFERDRDRGGRSLPVDDRDVRRLEDERRMGRPLERTFRDEERGRWHADGGRDREELARWPAEPPRPLRRWR